MHWNVQVPVSFFQKSSAAPGKQRRIGGIASDERSDSQGEEVLARALDFSPFLHGGWFNDNHSKQTADVLGYPEDAKMFRKGQSLPDGRKADANGWWVEGYLLETPEADRIWKLGKALEKTNRRLGFSLEGSIDKRSGPKTVWKKSEDGGKWVGKRIVKATVRNVAITNCFPGDVCVTGAAEAVTRRWYSGPFVELELGSGQKLTGTPNHPVFTARGWVALGDLDKLHDRVGCSVRDNLRICPPLAGGSAVVPHDVEHVPTSLREIFDFARGNASGVSHWVSAIGKGQFHGDVITNGNVDVVLIDSLLKRQMDAAFFQKFGKSALAASNKEQSLLTRLGAFPEHMQRVFATTADGLSLFDCSRAFSLLAGSRESGSAQLLLPLGSSNTALLSDVVDRSTRDPIFGSDSGRRLSAGIGFSHIVRKRCFEFSGHVFNLQTEHNWYSANGVIAHNCPVHKGSRMELLAKSVEAAENGADDDELEKMLAMGPVANPGHAVVGPRVGVGAGQIITGQSLERKKRPAWQKSLSDAEALRWVQSRAPNMTKASARRFVAITRQLKRNGVL